MSWIGPETMSSGGGEVGDGECGDEETEINVDDGDEVANVDEADGVAGGFSLSSKLAPSKNS